MIESNDSRPWPRHIVQMFLDSKPAGPGPLEFLQWYVHEKLSGPREGLQVMEDYDVPSALRAQFLNELPDTDEVEVMPLPPKPAVSYCDWCGCSFTPSTNLYFCGQCK